MDKLSQWFTVAGSTRVALVTAVLALVATAVAPREMKRRLRLVLVLVVLSVLSEFPQRLGFWEPAWAMLRAMAWAGVGCAAARLFVVIVADMAVGRMGARPMHQFRRDVMQATLYIAATVVSLRASGMSLQGLVTTGTVMTAIIGLALQETLGNLAAGAALQLDRNLDVGDWIRVDKSELLGRVVQMTWRTVVIETDDRTQYVVPNGVFTKTPFINYSRPGGIARRIVEISVPPEVPPVHVHEALLDACKDCVEVLTRPPPSVLTTDFGEQGVNYRLRYFIADFARRDPVGTEVATKVWYELHRRKIDLGMPRRKNYNHKLDERYEARALAEKIKDRRAAVDSVDFLRELSEEARDTLAREGRRLLFAPQEIILEAGHTGRTFYIVRHGEVSVRESDVELARLGPGDFFGEMALLTGEPRSATIVSVGEVEVFEIDELLFSRVLRAEPRVAERIGEVVGRRRAQIEARQAGAARATLDDVKGHTNRILESIRSLFGLDDA